MTSVYSVVRLDGHMIEIRNNVKGTSTYGPYEKSQYPGFTYQTDSRLIKDLGNGEFYVENRNSTPDDKILLDNYAYRLYELTYTMFYCNEQNHPETTCCCNQMKEEETELKATLCNLYNNRRDSSS